MESTETDHLYTLPLAESTAARNALAAALKKAGDAAAAAEIRGLGKPTKAAWALNQVARDRPDEVTALLEAGGRLRAAQEAALGGDAGGLRAATTGVAEAVASLVDAAVALAGDGQRDRLVATLRAAAVDDDAGAVLRAGRLERDLEQSGFGMGLITVPDVVTPTKRARKPDRKAVAEAERLCAAADRLEREAIDLDEAARVAAVAAEKAHERADAARRAADAASAALDVDEPGEGRG